MALGLDENLSENERRLLRAIIKYFPDPYDYIIGFHCQNLNDGKRSNGSSALGLQSSGYSAIKYRGTESPKIDHLSQSKIGSRDKKSNKNSTFEST
jgi:hypothetical protein